MFLNRNKGYVHQVIVRDSTSLQLNKHGWPLHESFKDYWIIEYYYYASQLIEMHGLTRWVTECYEQDQKITP